MNNQSHSEHNTDCNCESAALLDPPELTDTLSPDDSFDANLKQENDDKLMSRCHDLSDENPASMIPELAVEEDKEPPIPLICTERALDDASSREEDYYDDIAMQDKSRVAPSFETHYTDSSNLQTLEQGGCLFSFACRHELADYESEMVDSVVNLSAFEDETTDNYVPHLDIYSNSEYTILLARCAYLLTNINTQQFLAIAPTLLSSLSYQQACQPTGTTVWSDYNRMSSDNFRITKPIIPYVYNFTIQFRVSRIDDEKELDRLARHIHTRIDGGVLLERTKRSVPPKEDATVKCKSVLLYTDLGNDVILVTHLTVVVQAGLPTIIEQVIDSFGSWGLGETCETAWKTRRYLQRFMPAEAFMDAKDTEEVDAKDTEEVLPPQEENGASDNNDKFYDVVGANVCPGTSIDWFCRA